MSSRVTTFLMEILTDFGNSVPNAVFCGACDMTRLNEYVKVAEAAEILGVAQGTVRSWAEAGKIPMHKNPVNGYRLFRRKDLMKFLSTVAVPASTPKSRKS